MEDSWVVAPPSADGYDPWLAGALGAMQRRVEVRLALLGVRRGAACPGVPRINMAVSQTPQALAPASAPEPVRRGSFADYARQFPEVGD
jgi:hypothetical protein